MPVPVTIHDQVPFAREEQRAHAGGSRRARKNIDAQIAALRAQTKAPLSTEQSEDLWDQIHALDAKRGQLPRAAFADLERADRT